MAAFHEGELALQQDAGVRERLAEFGDRVIRAEMPQQHRDFFPLLPFVVVGSVDAQGQPWASVLAGAPGFMFSPDARLLEVRARPQAGDPLSDALRPGAPLGLLGIEPHTRRRNRLNGRVMTVDARGFDLHVDQSFGNCPKYIQARRADYTGARIPDAAVTRMPRLDERATRLVRAADTLFIASAHPRARDSGAPEHGVDVSHRGGRPGFVRVDDGAVLTLPDFTGNSYFNTLGNLKIHPRAGALFIDFARGDTLQVGARTEIITEGAELASFRGALRLLRLHVDAALFTEAALPLRWSEGEPSPVLEATGAWR